MIWRYSSIIFTCHTFQPSSISLLRVGNTFAISSPLDVTKLQKIVLMSHRLGAFHSQCQWTCIFLSLTNPMVMRTQLGFKQHRESCYSSQCSRKLWFWHLSVNIFTGRPSFMGARGAHKLHHGHNYSYQRVQNLKKSWFDTNVFYYFYKSPVSNPRPYHR